MNPHDATKHAAGTTGMGMPHPKVVPGLPGPPATPTPTSAPLPSPGTKVDPFAGMNSWQRFQADPQMRAGLWKQMAGAEARAKSTAGYYGDRSVGTPAASDARMRTGGIQQYPNAFTARTNPSTLAPPPPKRIAPSLAFGRGLPEAPATIKPNAVEQSFLAARPLPGTSTSAGRDTLARSLDPTRGLFDRSVAGNASTPGSFDRKVTSAPAASPAAKAVSGGPSMSMNRLRVTPPPANPPAAMDRAMPSGAASFAPPKPFADLPSNVFAPPKPAPVANAPRPTTGPLSMGGLPPAPPSTPTAGTLEGSMNGLPTNPFRTHPLLTSQPKVAASRTTDERGNPCPDGECCPNCGARLERGDDQKCNRCGGSWPGGHGKSAMNNWYANGGMTDGERKAQELWDSSFERHPGIPEKTNRLFATGSVKPRKRPDRATYDNREIKVQRGAVTHANGKFVSHGKATKHADYNPVVRAINDFGNSVPDALKGESSSLPSPVNRFVKALSRAGTVLPFAAAGAFGADALGRAVGVPAHNPVNMAAAGLAGGYAGHALWSYAFDPEDKAEKRHGTKRVVDDVVYRPPTIMGGALAGAGVAGLGANAIDPRYALPAAAIGGIAGGVGGDYLHSFLHHKKHADLRGVARVVSRLGHVVPAAAVGALAGGIGAESLGYGDPKTSHLAAGGGALAGGLAGNALWEYVFDDKKRDHEKHAASPLHTTRDPFLAADHTNTIERILRRQYAFLAKPEKGDKVDAKKFTLDQAKQKLEDAGECCDCDDKSAAVAAPYTRYGVRPPKQPAQSPPNLGRPHAAPPQNPRQFAPRQKQIPSLFAFAPERTEHEPSEAAQLQQAAAGPVGGRAGVLPRMGHPR